MNDVLNLDKMQSVGTVADNIINGLANERCWQGEVITEAGVYANVPIEKYHRDVDLFDDYSISSTGLRTVLKRPLEYWFTSPYNPQAEEPKEAEALNFGKAAHMLLLGEDGFSNHYALRPQTYENDKGEWKPWNANANACKEWLAKQKENNRSVITETEIEHIKRMADALSRKEAIRLGILNGRIERSIFSKRNNIWLKNRPDVIPNTSGDYVDLKTAQAVDDDSLSKAIFTLGYHIQAGFTRMLVRDVLGDDAFTSFTFVFVEKKAPYDVRVMTLEDADIDLGEQQARIGLNIFENCIKRDEWPGYDGHEQHISYVEMPAWGRARIEDQIRYSERVA